MNALKVIVFVAFLAGICYSAPAQETPGQPANELDAFNSVVQETLNNALGKLNAEYRNNITEKLIAKLNETTKDLNEILVQDLSNEIKDLINKLSNNSASFVESVNTDNIVLPNYSELVDESFNRINKVTLKKLNSSINALVKSTVDIFAGYQNQVINFAEFESKLLAQNQNSSIAKSLRENRVIAQNLVKDFFNQLDAQKEKALNVSIARAKF